METGFKRNLLAELLDSAGRGVVLRCWRALHWARCCC